MEKMSWARRYLFNLSGRKELLRLLVIWSAVCSLSYLVILATVSIKDSYFSGSGAVDLSKNYFQSVNDILTGGFLVGSEKCKIPDVDAWNSAVLPLIKEVHSFNCNQQPFFNLTYVVNNVIIINEDVLREADLGIDDVSCCYHVIERVRQSKESYTTDADNLYSYSIDCYKMEKATTPKSAFVKVKCESNGVYFKKLYYENYHLLVLLPDEAMNTEMGKKLRFWKKRQQVTFPSLGQSQNGSGNKNYSNPPNILILGLDSTSRLNFRRFMKRTAKILENKLGAVEMKGYTKVGENTFPNLVPLFTSFSEDELRKICYANRWVPQDSCPYIWKLFSRHNYLTALLEDSPEYSIFNYLKTAFIEQPVDMYIRPLMLAAYKEAKENPTKHDCLKYKRPEEIIMDYIMNLVVTADSRSIPYFIISWITDLTHDNMNNLQAVDDLFADNLLHLDSKGLLDNTLLFVMGDHGYRFLDVRSTPSGWFEDKLPALWIKLPKTIAESKPSWLEALQYNSKQLLSPFDIHEVLRGVLNTYVSPSEPLLKNPEIPILRGISPFTKIPNRTCKEADIPEDFCSCSLPVEYSANSTFIRLAAEYAVGSINRWLPDVCQPLSVHTITASGMFGDQDSIRNSTEKENFLPEIIIIAFKTTPGDFIFEGQVHYDKKLEKFTRVTHTLRMTRISTYPSCLKKEDRLAYETVCYCKGLLFK